MQKQRERMITDLRATLSIWTLLVALAAAGATAVNAETRVFFVEGTVSPSVQENTVLPEGFQFRTAAESVVVLREKWSVGESGCHGWTVVGSEQTHTVRSSAGGACRETNNADETLHKALTRQGGTSRVVFKVVAQAGMERGDERPSESDVFGYNLRERLGTDRPPRPLQESVPLTKPPRPRPESPPLNGGIYTIQQRSNGRYVDAHVTSDRDYLLVTRTRQDNDTQRWIFTPLGGNVYTIQQKGNGRYVDAHVTSDRDYELVTRTRQDNDTQRWILRRVGRDTYTIQQKSNGRYVDAHEHAGRDFALVTRQPQNQDTQRWVIRPD